VRGDGRSGLSRWCVGRRHRRADLESQHLADGARGDSAPWRGSHVSRKQQPARRASHARPKRRPPSRLSSCWSSCHHQRPHGLLIPRHIPMSRPGDEGQGTGEARDVGHRRRCIRDANGVFPSWDRCAGSWMAAIARRIGRACGAGAGGPVDPDHVANPRKMSDAVGRQRRALPTGAGTSFDPGGNTSQPIAGDGRGPGVDYRRTHPSPSYQVWSIGNGSEEPDRRPLVAGTATDLAGWQRRRDAQTRVQSMESYSLNSEAEGSPSMHRRSTSQATQIRRSDRRSRIVRIGSWRGQSRAPQPGLPCIAIKALTGWSETEQTGVSPSGLTLGSRWGSPEDQCAQPPSFRGDHRRDQMIKRGGAIRLA